MRFFDISPLSYYIIHIFDAKRALLGNNLHKKYDIRILHKFCFISEMLYLGDFNTGAFYQNQSIRIEVVYNLLLCQNLI